jgi:L-fuculose-phosphate aldolase
MDKFLKRNLNQLKRNIIEIGRRSYVRGYVASNDGNFSARIDKNRILITPTCVSKGFMKSTDLVIIDMKGNVIGGTKRPSSEFLLHLKVYQERSNVNSVCHLHPPYATAFAVAGISLYENVLPEEIISFDKALLIEYGTPGTEELYNKLHPHLHSTDAFLLANHGALTVGKDIFDAYNKMETLEHTAKILFIAKQLGNIGKLNEEEVKKLIVMREKFENHTESPPCLR